MPFILPILLIWFISIASAGGIFLYLGILGIKSGGWKKAWGIISIIPAFILFVYLGLIVHGFLTEYGEESEQFIGTYKSVIDSNSEQILLYITSSHFSMTPNTFTECTSGTWSIEFINNDYFIDFDCDNGHSLGRYYLKDNELIPLDGNLKFIKPQKVTY
jgi:hypothetical protein